MYEKFFDLNKLRKYENKSFIYERKSVGEENIYSYKIIIKEATKVKDFLQKHQVENRVGIAVSIKDHSAATCILIVGILNHECNFYCLDFEETKDVERYLNLSGVKYVISKHNLSLDIITKSTKNELHILGDIFYLYVSATESCVLKNVELCYTIATSGSTGEPKMVHVPYKCIEPNIKTLSRLLSIHDSDMVFLGSPPTFDPFVVELFLSLENGASILITSKDIRLQPHQLLQVMFPEEETSRKGVTIYQTTPSLFRLFDKQSIQDIILSKRSTLRCLILGGEEFPSSLELVSWLPYEFDPRTKRIFNIYGITEVSCWSSIYEYDAKAKPLGKNGMLPLGQPLDNLTFFRIVDELGNVSYNNNCKGELEIGSAVRHCFIPQCESDSSILESNDIVYRKTGDLVERDSTGNVYYIGRTNNTIKRLGKRLCLDFLNKKVEKLLNSLNIFYKVTTLWHQESSSLIFYFVSNNKVVINEKDCIIKVLQQNLQNYEKPDKMFFNNKLPLNNHGKVDGKKILQQLLMPPTSPVQIFEDFLKNVMNLQLAVDINESNGSGSSSTKRLKMSTNLSFIKAGGTSFQALSLATQIAELMEQNIEQRKLLEMLLDDNKTIDDILTFLITCSRKFRTEKNTLESVENLNTSYTFKLLWRCDLKKCIDASPSIYEGKFVAVGSHSHLILTVNALNGEKISCLELNHRIECPVVFVAAQLALVGCYDGFLYGFDFMKGAILWKLNANGLIKAKPLLVKQIIIVASYAEDFNVVAYDLETLVLVWRLKLGSKGIYSSPVQITQESMLLCSLDGTYALIEAGTGTIIWSKKLDTPIFSTAAKIQISNEIILAIAEVKGKVSICKATSGERISSFQTEGNIFSGLTLQQHSDYTNIIFGCHDQSVYCIKMDHTSKQLCLFSKFSLNSPVYSTPLLILNRYVLACSTKGLIILFNPYNNNVLASYDLKAEVFSSPCCLYDKFVYVGSRDNYLYALQLEK